MNNLNFCQTLEDKKKKQDEYTTKRNIIMNHMISNNLDELDIDGVHVTLQKKDCPASISLQRIRKALKNSNMDSKTIQVVMNNIKEERLRDGKKNVPRLTIK